MLFRPGWMFAALGLLATACAAFDPVPTEPDPQGAATAVSQSSAPEAPASLPEAPAAVAEVYVPPDPAQVVGMIQSDVRRLLGKPSIVRTESSGEVWQYRHSGCVMDLFLYRNGRPDTREVVYFELRDRQEGQKLSDLAARYCFGHILRA